MHNNRPRRKAADSIWTPEPDFCQVRTESGSRSVYRKRGKHRAVDRPASAPWSEDEWEICEPRKGVAEHSIDLRMEVKTMKRQVSFCTIRV